MPTIILFGDTITHSLTRIYWQENKQFHANTLINGSNQLRMRPIKYFHLINMFALNYSCV